MVSEMLEHIDGFIIRKFEWFSHLMQRTFGTRAVDLQRFSLACSLVFTFLRERKNGWPSTAFVAVLSSLAFAFTYVLNDYPSGTMNPQKLKHRTSRPIFFMISILFLYRDVKTVNLWYECWRCADYFEACDDLPPGESRVRKFVKAISAGMKQQVPVVNSKSERNG